MKQRCPNCGAKTGDEAGCGKCGYTLYENVFADVAVEVDEAMSEVSDYELSAVRRECGTAEKLTPEEFERKWCAENHTLASDRRGGVELQQGECRRTTEQGWQTVSQMLLD